VRGAPFVFGPSSPGSRGCSLRQAMTYRSLRYYGRMESMKENYNKKDNKDDKSKGNKKDKKNKKNKKNKKSKNKMDKKVKRGRKTDHDVMGK
jgi:hypothetical protein